MAKCGVIREFYHERWISATTSLRIYVGKLQLRSHEVFVRIRLVPSFHFLSWLRRELKEQTWHLEIPAWFLETKKYLLRQTSRMHTETSTNADGSTERLQRHPPPLERNGNIKLTLTSQRHGGREFSKWEKNVPFFTICLLCTPGKLSSPRSASSDGYVN